MLNRPVIGTLINPKHKTALTAEYFGGAII